MAYQSIFAETKPKKTAGYQSIFATQPTQTPAIPTKTAIPVTKPVASPFDLANVKQEVSSKGMSIGVLPTKAKEPDTRLETFVKSLLPDTAKTALGIEKKPELVFNVSPEKAKSIFTNPIPQKQPTKDIAKNSIAKSIKEGIENTGAYALFQVLNPYTKEKFLGQLKGENQYYDTLATEEEKSVRTNEILSTLTSSAIMMLSSGLKSPEAFKLPPGTKLTKSQSLEALGLTEKATQADIKARYLKMAKINHPDKGGLGTVFARINEAYQTLTKNAPPKIVPPKFLSPSELAEQIKINPEAVQKVEQVLNKPIRQTPLIPTTASIQPPTTPLQARGEAIAPKEEQPLIQESKQAIKEGKSAEEFLKANVIQKVFTNQNKGIVEDFLSKYGEDIKTGKIKTGEELSRKVYNEQGNEYFIVLKGALGSDDFAKLTPKLEASKTFDRTLNEIRQSKSQPQPKEGKSAEEFVLPKEVSVYEEAKKVGAKRISPDRVAHQKLTPNEGIKALVEKQKQKVVSNSNSWKNAAEQIDVLIKKYGDNIPKRTELSIQKYPGLLDDYIKYKRLKEYAPQAKTLPEIKEWFNTRADTIKWTPEGEIKALELAKKDYVELIKKDISKGYKFPEEVLNFDKSFKTAVDSRARYEKGLFTSFSADDQRIVFDEQNRIVGGMKRQDGKELLPNQKQEIIDGVLQTQKSLGIDLNQLSKDERWVYAHLNGKNPFLTQNAAGLYRKGDGYVSVSLGGTEGFDSIINGEKVRQRVNTTVAHEIGHALDHNIKGNFISNEVFYKLRNSYKPTESYGRGDKYWRSKSEVTARAIEQYVAIKEGHNAKFNHEGYWNEDIFNSIIKPEIEKSINNNFSQYITKSQAVKAATPSEKFLAKPIEAKLEVKKPVSIAEKSALISSEEIKTISEAIKNKETSLKRLGELEEEIGIMEETLEDNPASELKKYVARSGEFKGELPPVSGKSAKPTFRGKFKVRGETNSQFFSRTGDMIVTELGFEDSESARNYFNKYKKQLDTLYNLRRELEEVKHTQTAINLGEKLTQLARGDRRSIIKSIQKYFNLTDKEMRSINRQNITLMDYDTFKKYVDDLRIKAEKLEEQSTARSELLGQIQEKNLNIEPLRQAMKLPKISNMSTAQLKSFADTLEPYQKDDVFLGKRKLETIERTELEGLKTYREVRAKLADKLGIPLEKLDAIKVSEFDRMRGDTALAERNPFYKMLVEETAKLKMIRDAEYLEIEQKTLDLAKKLKTNLVGKLIPQQKNIANWFDSDIEGKKDIILTEEEAEIIYFMQEEWGKALDYLIKIEALKKGINKDNYYTHIRRGILEAVKEDGVIQAFKEIFDQQILDEANFNILDTQTGDILALDKFFRFAMKRTGGLKQTQNIVRSFLTYMKTFKKKQALDEIVPLIDIYAHALTPKGTTKEGLLLHGDLIRFTKEWLNLKKGRRITLLAKQGGKIDFALRAIKTFTSLLDLGFNIPVSLATQIGEQVISYKLLGKGKYVLSKVRALTKKGKRITDKYQNFIGKNPWKELIEPAREIGDRLSEGIFVMFSDANYRRSRNFLLGSMTKEEFASETISPERLAELRTKLGRYAVLSDAKSIIGATPEGGAFTQYKSWALPILRSELKNLGDLKKLFTSEKKLGKDALKDLWRTVEITAFVLILRAMLGDDKDESFIGKLKTRAYTEALTLWGAIQPNLIMGVPRMLSFINDLGNNLTSIIKLEEYKTSGEGYKKGEFKGTNKLKRQLTPRALKQFETTGTDKIKDWLNQPIPRKK